MKTIINFFKEVIAIVWALAYIATHSKEEIERYGGMYE